MSKPTSNSKFTTKVKCYICGKNKLVWTRDYNPNIKYSCSKEHQSIITSSSLMGHIVTGEIRTKLSNFFTGKKRSEETKDKITKTLTGHTVTEETRKKIGLGNLGKIVSEETRTKISTANKGKQTGKENPFFGKKHTDESRRKQSLAQGGTGVPYEYSDYPEEFNDELKETVRNRDGYVCQLCGMTEEEHLIVIGCSLNVHHIDYNKLNNILVNLISLCRQCHTRTNHNRNYWTDYWKEYYLNRITKEDTR